MDLILILVRFARLQVISPRKSPGRSSPSSAASSRRRPAHLKWQAVQVVNIPYQSTTKGFFRDASCSLVGIAKIACTQLADPSGKAYYMPLITKSWPKILDCSTYVLTTLMDAVASSPERDDPPTDTNIPGFKGIVFANIAGLYLSVFHFPEALARERRSSEIVAKIWAHTEPRDPNAAISSRALRMHCFALGRGLLAGSRLSDPRMREKGGSSGGVGERASGHLPQEDHNRLRGGRGKRRGHSYAQR